MARPSDQDGIKRFDDPLGPRRGPASPRPDEREARGFGWLWSVGVLVVVLVLAGPAFVVATRGWDVIGECRDEATRPAAVAPGAKPADTGFRQEARHFVGCVFTR